MNNNGEQQAIDKKQSLRKRRMAMGFATYLVPLTLMLLFGGLGILPVAVIIVLTLIVVAVHCIYLYLFNSGLNLRFEDPSLTTVQIFIAVLLTLATMYFVEPGQARAAFMMVVAIPFLYGILGLNIKKFLKLCLIFVILYSGLILLLWKQKPQILDPSLEVIQAVAFLLIITTIAIVGGFISQLRAKVRTRNLELRQALERIEELVNIDDLTGVCNRRRLFDVLSEESSRYNRGREPFSVCIIDIDHFKHVNDTWGHAAGDEILKAIAGSICENIRVIDTFGRYGGEEFLLVMPYTPVQGASIKAERIRQQVENMDFSDTAPGLRITISAGVAEYQAQEDVDQTLLRADNALYEAKHTGRNRVVTEKMPADKS
ncbi:MAG: GGDEF domain-containing protein [Thermodesulfobacteriota bacterium]